MISVALWSKFPSSFLSKIISKLKNHGIQVTHILTPSTRMIDLSDIVCVLLMNEKASHAETIRAKELARRYGKGLLAFSRKESNWSKTLDSLKRC